MVRIFSGLKIRLQSASAVQSSDSKEGFSNAEEIKLPFELHAQNYPTVKPSNKITIFLTNYLDNV